MHELVVRQKLGIIKMNKICALLFSNIFFEIFKNFLEWGRNIKLLLCIA